jgi:hypothetical protein
VTGVFSTTGSLGIGDTSPSSNARLSVIRTTADNFKIGYFSGFNGFFEINSNRATGGSYSSISGTYAGNATDYWKIGSNGYANGEFSIFAGTGSTERMRIDSAGNVGIGTTSPSQKLHVDNGSSSVRIRVSTTGSVNADTAYYNGLNSSSIGVDSAGNAFFYTGGAYPMIFSTNATERMRLDSSGNLGLGVTPSAWGSTYKAVQVGLGSSLAGVTNDVNLNLTNNAYFNGTNWIYIANSPSERYRIFNGEHQWFNAASGTAGNAVSYTQAMTLDASGNIRLGTTSAGAIVPAMSFVRGGTTWQLGPSVPTGGGNTFYVLNSSNIGVYLTSGGTSWSASSDERLKTDLKPIENAADKVSTLRSVTGRFKTDDEGVSRSFLIAQDVQAVLPEAVNVQDDEQGTLGVQYTDVIPLLVAAIKELKAIVDTQAEQIKALQGVK